MSLAHLVFGCARSVFDGVYEMVSQQECESAEDGRTVHCVQLVIQFPQGEWPLVSGQSAVHQQPCGCGFDTALLQTCYDLSRPTPFPLLIREGSSYFYLVVIFIFHLLWYLLPSFTGSGKGVGLLISQTAATQELTQE